MASPALKSPGPQPSKPCPRPRPRLVASIERGIEPRAFVKTPPEYDYLATTKKDADGVRRPMLSGLLQSNLIHWIGRRTFGHPDRPEWTTQSARQLAALTGSDSKNVAGALADLIARKIIACRGETDAANARKQYRLTPEHWKTARPYSPALDEDRAERLRLSKVIERGWDPALHSEETVQPGAKSRPVNVAVPVKSAEPFGLKIVYHSELENAISFKARAARNGTLNVTACLPAAKQAMVPIPTRGEANTEFARYRDYLFPLVLNLWSTATDEAFVRRVFEAAAGAPLETFQDQVSLKFPHASEARKHKPGLLRNLAEQAAKTHRARQAMEKESLSKMPIPAPQKPPAPLDPARRWDRIRRELQDRLSAESYDNWFARTRQLDETPAYTVVAVDASALVLIRDEYAQLIADICARLGEPASITWREEA
jgi:hypothetical protein